MALPTKKQFEQHSQDDFTIEFLPGERFPCEIEEVKSGLQAQNESRKEQFSVVFACSEPQVFEQGVYPVYHSELGDFELFLVPIFGDDQGVHYEAVFT